jgi:molybdopterin synthase catalytic subunit
MLVIPAQVEIRFFSPAAQNPERDSRLRGHDEAGKVLAMTAAPSRLRDGPLKLEDWLPATPPADCGALSVFAGTVRNIHEGRAVSGMRYHAHAALAEARLAEIEAETAKRFGVTARVAHAVGDLKVGDISVIVVVSGGHRAESFAASRWAIDTIKQAVPIWKEEFYVDGTADFLEGVPLLPVSTP